MRAFPWSALPTPTGEPWSYLTTCWAHLWYGGYDQANSPRESRTTSSKLGMTPRPENPATSRNHCTSLKRSGILPAIPSGAGSCDDIGCGMDRSQSSAKPSTWCSNKAMLHITFHAFFGSSMLFMVGDLRWWADRCSSEPSSLAWRHCCTWSAKEFLFGGMAAFRN